MPKHNLLGRYSPVCDHPIHPLAIARSIPRCPLCGYQPPRVPRRPLTRWRDGRQRDLKRCRAGGRRSGELRRVERMIPTAELALAVFDAAGGLMRDRMEAAAKAAGVSVRMVYHYRRMRRESTLYLPPIRCAPNIETEPPNPGSGTLYHGEAERERVTYRGRNAPDCQAIYACRITWKRGELRAPTPKVASVQPFDDA